MATLPIIPRNDGEGSLGIETKQWGDIQTKKINGESIDKILTEDNFLDKKLIIPSTGSDLYMYFNHNNYAM